MDETTQGNIALDTAAEQKTEETTEATAPEEEAKTFTQEELNSIVKERLDRQTAKFLERLNLESMDGIDGLLDKAKGYEEAAESMAKYQLENEALRTEIAFRDNGVNLDKADDIKAYFKGKGLTLDEATLKEELSTHPEWSKREPRSTTIRTLSPEKDAPKSVDGWERARKYFGL